MSENMRRQKQTVHCKVISDLFCYGANKSEPEIRATAIKALMRHTFRITACIEKGDELFQKEAQLFGDAKTKASPISLQVQQHAYKGKWMKTIKYKDQKKCGIPQGTLFNLILRKSPVTSLELEDYYKLLKLSFILGGLGSRNRRARGCVTLADNKLLFENKTCLLDFIVETLNWLNKTMNVSNHDLYSFASDGNINYIVNSKEINTRPVIEKIIIGEKIIENNVNYFLEDVDCAAHKTKAYFYAKETKTNERCNSESSSQLVENYKNGYYFNTGYANKILGRFASSLIVSLTTLKDGSIYPVYTYITPVTKNKLSMEKDDRNNFLNYIKKQQGVRA